MRKFLIPLAAAAALLCALATPGQAKASWLSELLHARYDPVYYAEPYYPGYYGYYDYAAPAVVETYYTPGVAYYGSTYYAPTYYRGWYGPRYYGGWRGYDRDWYRARYYGPRYGHEWHEHGDWHGHHHR